MPSVALRRRRFGNSQMPSSIGEAVEQGQRREPGTRASRSSPRREAPAGAASPACRGVRKKVLSRGSSPKWRSREGLHPLAEGLLGGGDEHHPHALGRPLGERPGDRDQGRDAGGVVVGPGHRLRGADVGEAPPPTAAESTVPALVEPALPGQRLRRRQRRDRRRRAPAGAGWCRLRSMSPEAGRHSSGIAGWKQQPGVRRVVVGDEHDGALGVRAARARRRPGSARRRGRSCAAAACRGGRSSAAAAAAAAAIAPPSIRRPRSAATPATAPAPAASPSGHQKVPCTSSTSISPSAPELAQASRAAIRPPAAPPARPWGGGSRPASRPDRAANPGRDAVRLRAEARVAPVAIGGETYRLIPKMGPCPCAAR